MDTNVERETSFQNPLQFEQKSFFILLITDIEHELFYKQGKPQERDVVFGISFDFRLLELAEDEINVNAPVVLTTSVVSTDEHKCREIFLPGSFAVSSENFLHVDQFC